MEKKGYTKREENAMGYLFKNKMLGKKSPHFFYNQKLNKNQLYWTSICTCKGYKKFDYIYIYDQSLSNNLSFVCTYKKQNKNNLKVEIDKWIIGKRVHSGRVKARDRERIMDSFKPNSAHLTLIHATQHVPWVTSCDRISLPHSICK